MPSGLEALRGKRAAEITFIFQGEDNLLQVERWPIRFALES